MTIASRNLLKNGVGVAKEKYKSDANCSTFKKVTPASSYLKSYFSFNSVQKIRLRLPIVTPQLWLKLNNLCNNCKLLRLVSVLLPPNLVSSQSRYPKLYFFSVLKLRVSRPFLYVFPMARGRSLHLICKKYLAG